MQKNLSSQQEQEKIAVITKEQKDNKPSSREIVIKRLGYRGLEVLQNAEQQFPQRNSDCS